MEKVAYILLDTQSISTSFSQLLFCIRHCISKHAKQNSDLVYNESTAS